MVLLGLLYKDNNKDYDFNSFYTFTMNGIGQIVKQQQFYLVTRLNRVHLSTIPYLSVEGVFPSALSNVVASLLFGT